MGVLATTLLLLVTLTLGYRRIPVVAFTGDIIVPERFGTKAYEAPANPKVVHCRAESRVSTVWSCQYPYTQEGSNDWKQSHNGKDDLQCPMLPPRLEAPPDK